MCKADSVFTAHRQLWIMDYGFALASPSLTVHSYSGTRSTTHQELFDSALFITWNILEVTDQNFFWKRCMPLLWARIFNMTLAALFNCVFNVETILAAINCVCMNQEYKCIIYEPQHEQTGQGTMTTWTTAEFFTTTISEYQYDKLVYFLFPKWTIYLYGKLQFQISIQFTTMTFSCTKAMTQCFILHIQTPWWTDPMSILSARC